MYSCIYIQTILACSNSTIYFSDYLKLDDLLPEESSDSSDNSSLGSNLSKDKLKLLEKDVDTSSESSEDEYIPKGDFVYS